MRKILTELRSDYPVINLFNNVVVIQYRSFNLILTEDKSHAKDIAKQYIPECDKVMWEQLLYTDVNIAEFILKNVKKYYGRNLESFFTFHGNCMILQGYLTM